MTGVLTIGVAVRWCESSGSEPDRARERLSPWLPTRGTVLLGDGEDPAQHGSTGKGSWATQAGDLGVKATFDHSSQWSRRLRSAVRVRHPIWLVRTNDQRTRRVSRNCLPSRSLRGAGYASACSLVPLDPVDGKHGGVVIIPDNRLPSAEVSD